MLAYTYIEKEIIICEQSEERRKFIRTHYPQVQVVLPDECKEIVGKTSEIEEAYRIFENKLDGVIKVAVEP